MAAEWISIKYDGFTKGKQPVMHKVFKSKKEAEEDAEFFRKRGFRVQLKKVEKS